MVPSQLNSPRTPYMRFSIEGPDRHADRSHRDAVRVHGGPAPGASAGLVAPTTRPLRHIRVLPFPLVRSPCRAKSLYCTMLE